MTITITLGVIAIILFILAALNVSSPINLTAAGLACFAGAMLLA